MTTSGLLVYKLNADGSPRPFSKVNSLIFIHNKGETGNSFCLYWNVSSGSLC